MSLILHAGGEPVTYEQLRAYPIPIGTQTHVPVPHHRLVDMTKHALTYYGHEVVEEHHAIARDGDRYFGVLSLKSAYGDYTDMVGLRNSHDKSCPVGVAFGSRVFVCDNMAFSADHVVRRKHTAKALRDIHSLLAELIEPLALQREAQHRQITAYKATQLDEREANHLIIRLFKDGVLNIQRIPEVLAQWETPQHPWEPLRSCWHFFNGVTSTLSGRVAEAPNMTRHLHRVLDEVCERIC